MSKNNMDYNKDWIGNNNDANMLITIQKVESAFLMTKELLKDKPDLKYVYSLMNDELKRYIGLYDEERNLISEEDINENNFDRNKINTLIEINIDFLYRKIEKIGNNIGEINKESINKLKSDFYDKNKNQASIEYKEYLKALNESDIDTMGKKSNALESLIHTYGEYLFSGLTMKKIEKMKKPIVGMEVNNIIKRIDDDSEKLTQGRLIKAKDEIKKLQDIVNTYGSIASVNQDKINIFKEVIDILRRLIENNRKGTTSFLIEAEEDIKKLENIVKIYGNIASVNQDRINVFKEVHNILKRINNYNEKSSTGGSIDIKEEIKKLEDIVNIYGSSASVNQHKIDKLIKENGGNKK